MKMGWKSGGETAGETAGYCRRGIKLPANQGERLPCPF